MSEYEYMECCASGSCDEAWPCPTVTPIREALGDG